MTREEAREHIKERMELYIHSTMDNFALHKALEALEQPERKKGKWIRCENPMYSPFDCSGEYTFRCTVCYKKNNEQTRYCPNCGAKMEVEQ